MPPLSIVVATTHAWPEIEPCLVALVPQADLLDAEIIVVDGDGRGVDPSVDSPRVRVVPAVGESIFALRARGLAAARADVIAVTEDHCVPDDRWCECLLDGLTVRHPDKAVVAGATTNGSPDHPLDRASFLMTAAEVMPPIDTPSLTRVPPPNNFAIRASAAAEVAGVPGRLELELLPRLWREGAFALHSGARVSHVQRFSLAGACAHHFFNGRASAGMAPALPRTRSLRDWLAHPARLVRPVVRSLAGKGGIRREWAALAPVGMLAVCHVAGEAVGAYRGPGRSPYTLS